VSLPTQPEIVHSRTNISASPIADIVTLKAAIEYVYRHRQFIEAIRYLGECHGVVLDKIDHGRRNDCEVGFSR
jgi:hypothetical protein